MDHVFKTGAHVIFVDSCRQPHDALITNCWGAEGKTLDEYKKAYDAKNSPCINLVYVEGDALRTDSYGRQIGQIGRAHV